MVKGCIMVFNESLNRRVAMGKAGIFIIAVVIAVVCVAAVYFGGVRVGVGSILLLLGATHAVLAFKEKVSMTIRGVLGITVMPLIVGGVIVIATGL
jgi:hypothetical protein